MNDATDVDRDDANGDGRKSYHHGHLREALILAARTLIAENGPQGFTLADAAKHSGVSAAAPYRHFRDKKALIAAVAREGFRVFTERMAKAFAAGKTSQDGFMRMGRAYLDFARGEPGYYQAIFASGLAHEDIAVPGAPSGPLEALEKAIADQTDRWIDPKTARILALEVWALSHGIASLAAANELSPLVGAPDPAELLAHGVNALVRGATLTAPAPANAPSSAIPPPIPEPMGSDASRPRPVAAPVEGQRVRVKPAKPKLAKPKLAKPKPRAW